MPWAASAPAFVGLPLRMYSKQTAIIAPMPAVVPYEAAARVRSGPARKLAVSNASEDYATTAA